MLAKTICALVVAAAVVSAAFIFVLIVILQHQYNLNIIPETHYFKIK